MPTYVYETIPQKPGQKPRSFEVKQSMHDAALTRHPETGEPVQRIISGGIGLITHHASPPPREGCCRANGGECCCSCEN